MRARRGRRRQRPCPLQLPRQAAMSRSGRCRRIGFDQPRQHSRATTTFRNRHSPTRPSVSTVKESRRLTRSRPPEPCRSAKPRPPDDDIGLVEPDHRDRPVAIDQRRCARPGVIDGATDGRAQRLLFVGVACGAAEGHLRKALARQLSHSRSTNTNRSDPISATRPNRAVVVI